MLNGHEPWDYKKAWEMHHDESGRMTALGTYLWTAHGVDLCTTKGDMYELKEELDSIRRNGKLNFDEIKQGFQAYLEALYPGCECKTLKYQFGRLLTIDTSIPHGAIEF